jgi:hypothetical protein
MPATLKKSPSTVEVYFHTVIHFLGVVFIFWLAAFPPLWITLPALVIEYLQMKLLGHCFLTNIAHSRGVMVGFTYWTFVAKLMGFKDYQKIGRSIDKTIMFGIVLIVLIRLIAIWL